MRTRTRTRTLLRTDTLACRNTNTQANILAAYYPREGAIGILLFEGT